MRCSKSIIVSLILFTLINLAFAQSPKDFNKMRAKWIYRVSKNTKKLSSLYLKQGVMIQQENMILGQEAIRRHVNEHPSVFRKLSSTESLQLYKHSDRKILDLGYLNIEDELKNVTDRLLYVVAWRKIGNDWLRELDIILSDNVEFVDDELAAERSTWVKYANGDDPAAMVSSLFLRDAVYLNNSEASKGHPALTKRFDFIKNPAFHINLKNEKFVKIGDSTAVDIGNWETNDFVGYYLIQWKKDEAGDWKIALYFNF